MAERDPKVEEWKEKFFKVSDSLEKQQEYEQLLERSLNRLALLSQGQDPGLDKHLLKIRKLLRGNSRNPGQVEEVLRALERSIVQMDEKGADKSNLSACLVKLIDYISWPKEQQKAASALGKKAQKAEDKSLPMIIEDLSSLIQQGFLSDERQAPQGFFSKLFGTRKLEGVNQDDNLPIPLLSDRAEGAVSPSSQEILITLLEKLSLPQKFTHQATKIRNKIQRGIVQSELPGVIDDIASLVSDIGGAAIDDKQEYETFLLDLTEKITMLEQQLHEFEEDEVSAYSQRRQLGNNVKAEMNHLRTDVEDANNLTQLRQTVSSRIDNLNQHINHAHNADVERFTQAQEQVKQLNQRLQVMEAESENLRKATIKAQELALKDALTGIWNRQALNDVLEREYARWQRYQTPLTMVFWDIDHFKDVNDQFGHSAGDVVLKTIAQIFNKKIRKADFIARFGGEEFVGLFPETDLETALVLTNKVRQIIAETHFYHQDITVPITASAGLAMFEGDDSIDDVFERADKALYSVKSNGRNNCVVLRKQDK
ncbi:GGDEF domain-containing protein [Methylophaga sp.]|uniref:GGDEF domain-containing protein n=1 Tax=Methylophaga sp. TaxID=2024840 RepID=UPI003F69EC96